MKVQWIIPAQAELAERIEAFLSKYGMPVTHFSTKVAGHPHFVNRLRAGQTRITLDQARNALQFMAQWEADYDRHTAGA